MELQEQINALNAEKDQYIKLLTDSNADKIVLDQQLVETLKQLLGVKKDLLLANERIRNLEEKINKESHVPDINCISQSE